MKLRNANCERNKHGEPLVVGCNYHTTWQMHKRMRFVLKEVNMPLATLFTRKTKKEFKTHVDTLIFIPTVYNTSKALTILNNLNE